MADRITREGINSLDVHYHQTSVPFTNGYTKINKEWFYYGKVSGRRIKKLKENGREIYKIPFKYAKLKAVVL